MLASPEQTAADVFERVKASVIKSSSHSEKAGPEADVRVNSESPAAWVEDKYDGVRCQMHKVGTRVALYSRDLKDITSTFLDIADAYED